MDSTGPGLNTYGGFPLFRAEQARALDRCAIDEHGINGYDLMQRAGAAAFADLGERWPGTRSMLVLAGAGNNGGDGYVIARLAQAQGIDVTLVALCAPEKLSGDAALAAADFLSQGGKAVFELPESLVFDVVVDALLGTGLDRVVSGRYAQVIESLNAAGQQVMAVDIPSGVHADTGAIMGCAVKAQMTVTFIGRKQGLYTGEAPAYVGALVYQQLKVPQVVINSQPPSAWLMGDQIRRALLKPREQTSHKGRHGHVLVIGGNHGMAGAARLAGEAGLRCGAGLVSVATRPEHVAAIVGNRPELMVRGVATAQDLEPMLARADVIALGPGLGNCQWARSLMQQVLPLKIPLVLDADGLNLLAEGDFLRSQWVLTPHPGEAARLLNTDTAALQQDRFAAVDAIAQQRGAVVVLKGSGTLVQQPGQSSQMAPRAAPWICPAGNPGMGTAGMGDVLTGTIAGLWAQGLSGFDAAALGVWLHARAGDRAARNGQRGLLASDLMAPLRDLVNPES